MPNIVDLQMRAEQAKEAEKKAIASANEAARDFEHVERYYNQLKAAWPEKNKQLREFLNEQELKLAPAKNLIAFAEENYRKVQQEIEEARLNMALVDSSKEEFNKEVNRQLNSFSIEQAAYFELSNANKEFSILYYSFVNPILLQIQKLDNELNEAKNRVQQTKHLAEHRAENAIKSINAANKAEEQVSKFKEKTLSEQREKKQQALEKIQQISKASPLFQVTSLPKTPIFEEPAYILTTSVF